MLSDHSNAQLHGIMPGFMHMTSIRQAVRSSFVHTYSVHVESVHHSGDL
jgi:hypothetical protein